MFAVRSSTSLLSPGRCPALSRCSVALALPARSSLRHAPLQRPGQPCRAFSDGAGNGTGSGGSGGNGGGGNGGDSGSSSGDGAHPLRPWTFLFAAMFAGGGLMAFAKKGSRQSLGAGLGAGLILALCARSMVGASMVGSARVAFGLCLMLGLVMASRFSSSRKFMPAGLVATTSLGLSVAFVAVGL